VLSAHNEAWVGQVKYEFNERFLLVDLYDQEGAFSLVELWDPNTKDLRLIKYHLSTAAQNAIFVFLQRNEENLRVREDSSQRLTGVYFFMVLTFV